MGRSRNIFIIIIAVYIAYRYNSSEEKLPSPIVSTSYGDLQGVISVSRDGRQFYEYLGIQYGKSKRFESPETPDKWDGVKSAMEYGEKCMHVDLLLGNLHGKEDCLFLNVFTPNKLRRASEHELYPVMVFIHGGHFTEGSANGHRPEYFMDEDVVLVTINYRLGALGFLNTNDGLVKGNMGMKDQQMALRWVQENIRSFGGNPEAVTLFGESAGSAAVHYHVLSPTSKGLFQRAISQSGVALNEWTLMLTPEKQAKRFAGMVNCPTSNSQAMVKCLKSKPAEELVVVHREILSPLRDPISVFVPSVEKLEKGVQSFLVESPDEIMRKGNFNKVPWITGVNSEEGLITSTMIMRNESLLHWGEIHWEEVAPKFLYYDESDVTTSQKIRDFYFGKDTKIDTLDKLDNYTALLGDRHFFVGVAKAIELHAKEAPTFIYYYTYPGEFTLANILLSIKGKYPVMVEVLSHVVSSWVRKTIFGINPPRYGICHADELSLFFPIPGLTDVPTGHQDYEMSKEVVKLWVDFATDEKSMEFKDNKWEPVQNGKKLKYLNIDSKSGYVDQPYKDRIAFWESLKIKSLQ